MPRLAELDYDHSFAQLPDAFRAHVQIQPLRSARLAAFNSTVAAQLDLEVPPDTAAQLVAAFNGEQPMAGWQPIACVYAGHQFGHYVPQLGDGRAMLLAEVRNPQGQRWDLQLKGAGPTPFSRRGDGRAVLRSSIREYLASIALTGLGLPSTQALCLIASDEPVYRERPETGALLVRVAPSHLRFGSFEYFTHSGQIPALQQLLDYTLARHFPDLQGHPDPACALLERVVDSTAQLIAGWQAYGFTHGVLNTDNMSILGLALDHGPYAFVEAYQPDFCPNHSDSGGRYALNQQPSIGLWNLTALAEALLPLTRPEALRDALDRYSRQIGDAYAQRMRQRLGLVRLDSGDRQLLAGLLELLHQQQADYNGFFRWLSDWQPDAESGPSPFNTAPWHAWLQQYRQRLAQEPDSAHPTRSARMRAVNPRYLLRTGLAQQIIEAATANNYQPLDELARILARPFDDWPEYSHYAQPGTAAPTELSCSS